MTRRWHRVVLAALVGAAAVAWFGRGAWRASERPHDAGTAPPAVRLPRGSATTRLASIAGTITDGREPIAGARVCAMQRRHAELPCAPTNERGAYVLSGLAAGVYVVSAGVDGYMPRETMPMELAGGDVRTGVDLALYAGGGLLTGTVHDLGGGPIAHARIEVQASRSGEHAPPVDTDAEGRFRIWTWRGDVMISASAEGYADALVSTSSPTSVELVLTPASSISGTVLDAATRAPIPNATVTLSPPGRDSTESGSAGDDGTFVIDGIEPGRYDVAAIAPHGYGRSAGSIRAGFGQHVTGVVVLVHPAFALEGRVVLDGSPPAPCRQASVWIKRDHSAVMDGSTYGPNGAIRVDGLLPGTYEVTPSCEEPSHAGSAVEVTIADRDVVDQTWTVPAAAAIPVRGRVLSAAGAPVAGARIIVEWARGATSGADGRYELDLAPGAYDVDVVSEAGVLPEKRRVHVANAPIQQDLVLADGGAIRGRIVDGDGRPLSGVRIALDDRDQPSGTDGSFLFEQIKPGAHAVDAIPHDGASLEQEVTVRAHETTAVTFTAEAMSTELRGTVLGVDGHPAKNAFVTIARELDGNVRAYARDAPRILTGADGTFAQTKLPGGVYTVRAFDDTGDALAEHVRSGTTVRLQLKPTGTISGVVRRGAVGVRDLRVYLDDRATGVRRRERFYETDGRYRLADVPPGSYLLSATDGDAEVHVHVDVGDARPVVVDLSLDDTITLTGRVLDFATNAPAAGALVWARSQYTSHSSTADAAGTFSIPGVAAGTVELEVGGEHAYWIHQITREVDRSSSNLGDLFAVAASTDYKDVGRLGIRFASDAPSIQAIDPSSPAAASGLVVGDVVTSINGVDVSSADVQLAADLLYVPVGAPVQLGLARGVTVTIVAAPRSTDR